MIWILLAAVLPFGIGAILGAPYLPVRRHDAEMALDLAGLLPGQHIVDLGSGDGRILLAAAKRGATATGYEINPIMYLWSKLICFRYRHFIKIKLADYWSQPLPQADVIYIFLIDRYTNKLDVKLKQELISPTKVVSYVFKLPRKPIKKTSNTFLYVYP